jgi:hypothetical protein
VTLLERADRVGGQARLAARTPGRSELVAIVEWLEQQCLASGVEIRTGHEGTPETVASLEPDVIVVATGARYRDRPATGRSITGEGVGELAAHLRLVSLGEALAGNIEAEAVVVYDAAADWPGFNVTRVLAERGARVRYVTPEPYPGAALEVTNWRLEYQVLAELGVEFLPVTEIVGSVPGGVVLRRGFARMTETVTGVDALVWLDAPVPNSGHGIATAGSNATIVTVGDAYAPRGIEQAILDARLTGSRL